jgi:hypothetical protein
MWYPVLEYAVDSPNGSANKDPRAVVKRQEFDVTEPQKKKPPAECGQPFPFCFDLDVIDALRCPNCDALFEHGKFICYGAKSTQ